MRVHAVLGVAAAGVAMSLAGCAKPESPYGDRMVQFGSTKADLFGMPAEYRAIHSRLEKIFDSAVVFRAQPNGPALAEQLKQGLIAYAFMSANEFASVEDATGLMPVAIALNSAGKSSRKAYIVIRAHSHLKSILDCKGKRFAFGIYRDLLTDRAARAALEKAGVRVKDLLIELLTPPPLGLEGRLYVGRDVPGAIAGDLTVNAGVVDEIQFAKLKQTGGSFLLGASKDQFEIVGETIEVPEMLVVAGPAADPAITAKLKAYLIDGVKSDMRVRDDFGVMGFAEPSLGAYDAVRAVLAASK